MSGVNEDLEEKMIKHMIDGTSDIIDAKCVDGVVSEDDSIRAADVVLTANELTIVVTTLQWACQYANKESVDEILPVIAKIKAMVTPR